MAEKRRFFDIWFTKANTVYKEVPYNVVADWVQQARLNAEDRLRPSGTKEWFRIGDFSQFSVFLPSAEPSRVGAEAEALEPVDFEFHWRRQSEDVDDEVDMIPLIDISLVLLIFFLMTTTVAAVSHVLVPEAKHSPEMVNNPEAVWIGITRDPIEGTPVYQLSRGTAAPLPENSALQLNELLAKFDEEMERQGVAVEVRVAAHRELRIEEVNELTAELQKRKQARVAIDRIVAEVNEIP